ncbi:hypothetical protein JXM67_08180 [candidate division WOR-3 bacterium]|nr:hypothetical protein [candidate division WOR-3 bacterium]
MKRNIPLAILLISQVLGAGCRTSEPLTLEEYRECRQAIYDELPSILTEAYSVKHPRQVLKSRVRMICRDLGYSYPAFDSAHTLYGYLNLSYSQELKAYGYKRYPPRGIFYYSYDAEKILWYHDYDTVTSDLIFDPYPVIEIQRGPQVWFCGIKVNAKALPDLLKEHKDARYQASSAAAERTGQVIQEYEVMEVEDITLPFDFPNPTNYMNDKVILDICADVEYSDAWPVVEGIMDRSTILSFLGEKLAGGELVALYAVSGTSFVTTSQDTLQLDILDKYAAYVYRKDSTELAFVVTACEASFETLLKLQSMPFHGSGVPLYLYFCSPDEFEYYDRRSVRIDWEAVQKYVDAQEVSDAE